MLAEKHVSLVNGAINSRERSVFLMWNKTKEEDRKKVLFSLKPVSLTVSLYLLPHSQFMCTSFLLFLYPDGLSHPTHTAIQLHKKARLPSLPLSCLSVPVPGPRAALAGRTSIYSDIQKAPAAPHERTHPQRIQQILTSLC